MNLNVAFFEIPTTDFYRAVNFYQNIFGVTLSVYNCEHEKMAFFPGKDENHPGAVSYSGKMDFKPSGQGVLISLRCENMDFILSRIVNEGGEILTPKTKILADNRGYFSIFIDSEGNRVGLCSDK